jgi:hypothetical protein
LGGCGFGGRKQDYMGEVDVVGCWMWRVLDIEGASCRGCGFGGRKRDYMGGAFWYAWFYGKNLG